MHLRNFWELDCFLRKWTSIQIIDSIPVWSWWNLSPVGRHQTSGAFINWDTKCWIYTHLTGSFQFACRKSNLYAEYSFVLQAMLTATSQIEHVNPHLSQTLDRQDFEQRFIFPSPYLLRSNLPLTSFLAFCVCFFFFFCWFPMELGHLLSQRDWQIGSNLNYIQLDQTLQANSAYVKHVTVPNLILGT